MRKIFFFAGLLCSLIAFAGDNDSTKIYLEQLQKIDSIELTLHYKTGKVVLENGLATLNIAPGFKFLDS
ncbi:MAG TPA: hypothetical protein VFL47_02740, partial [Flavisolibacter sp.]|nr:hypothetical protein [Flavisolibacter sp.]